MNEKKGNIESPSLLYKEFDWYSKLFPLALQKSCDEFFLPGLNCHLIGISKNINLLQEKEAHFVTKVRIDKFYDVFLRISTGAMNLLLNKALGRSAFPFKVDRISELEKDILSNFSAHVSKIIVPLLEPPPVVNFVRTNFDMTHLTFLLKDKDDDRAVGRFIISVPDGRLAPNKIESDIEKFDFEDFYDSYTDTKLIIGKTRFTVDDMKSLEYGDLVIFEESDLSNLTLYINDDVKEVHIEPNFNIAIPFDENNGGDEMADKAAPKNLWDSIEIDMYAEIDPVKITLGNLKKIELGEVVDIATLYDNRVTLRVENKVIGHGELVIVNDKYGVKITDILQKKNVLPVPQEQNQDLGEETSEDFSEENVIENEQIEDNIQETSENPEENPQEETNNEDNEFDYSGFELEDEDI